MTNVNFRFLDYREQPFVLAKDFTQVFYVKDLDPANKEEHHIVLQGKREIVAFEDVVDEEEYNQFDALPPFDEDITIPTIDDTEEPMYIDHDHDEAIIVRWSNLSYFWLISSLCNNCSILFNNTQKLFCVCLSVVELVDCCTLMILIFILMIHTKNSDFLNPLLVFNAKFKIQ
jgi:hypothetical protein